LINFEGYSIFWVALFAMENNDVEHNALYLHSDMYGEWSVRFPSLEKNFRLYRLYDALVSVSEKTMEHNRVHLSGLFGLRKEQFTYSHNVQDSKDIFARANEPLEPEEDHRIFEDSIIFINISRLSPEKDQEKLIRAFKKVADKYSQSKLIIIGQGALQHSLEVLIEVLSLTGKVLLLGQKYNPMPYLKRSDCFVLSSNHEGQPMTLFEALILKKPIIATDIAGNRSVLEGRPGHLVENSEEGLAQGMLDFLEGKYKHDKKFDHEAYNREALKMFYEKVIGKKYEISVLCINMLK